MKPFKEVEQTRKLYHAKPAVNSVHRSSLLVPEIAGAVAEISFVNHFLIKRQYANVGCRITALGLRGERVESHLHAITEPRAYTFQLSDTFDQPVSGYMVEFFAADNLFIPFPAVMVNHRGPGFLNTVHSYNRSLNDVFEDDAINANSHAEASIDVATQPGFEPFLLFTAGPLGCRGELEVEFAAADKTWRKRLPLDVVRLSHTSILLRSVFPDLPAGVAGVLKVRQPRQPLFYGRLFVGHYDAEGRFTGNHSYYDSSDAPEYWEDRRDSYRAYPFFPDLDNRVRMYPIMSPGELSIAVALYGAGGTRLAEAPVGSIRSPGARFVDVSVDELTKQLGMAPERVESFAVIARCGDDRMPTRVNHQLVYSRGGLESSINVSLISPNVFVPPKKTGLAWGQMPVGRGLRSWLGFVGNDPAGKAADLEITFYGAAGELGRITRPLPAGGAVRLDSTELDASWEEVASETPRYLWYMARTSRPDLTAYVVTSDLATGHCTGEHSF